MRRCAAVVAVALALLAGACGDSDDDTKVSGGATNSALNVAKIAVIAPLDAGLVQFGRGIRNSVQLAVDQANAGQSLPHGWRLEVLALDDSSNPETGEAAARRAAADPAVIGVVGTYNSGVAARVAPVLETAGIAMVSPGNTDPGLTLGPDLTAPRRPRPNYFRMVTSDNIQGPFLARYAFDLGARRVSVVTETKPVSRGMADAFSSAFAAAGGHVVSTQVVPDGTTDFASPVVEIVPLRPDLVFYGGEYVQGTEFSKQAKAAGITAPVMGSDGLKDDAYIAGIGPASEGDLASSIGSPAASIPSARRYLDAYADAGYAEPPSDFGVYAYDAARVIIAAAKVALDGTDRVTVDERWAIVAGIQGTDMAGASGGLAFDEFGDPRSRALTVYRVAGGRWTAVKIETLH